ncbi:uncharacterized protein TNCV_2081651 [Trichonephila clavipes]|nr:uncharacterized protein TNCV_2081651 [Trichonephila clavipes]
MTEFSGASFIPLGVSHVDRGERVSPTEGIPQNEYASPIINSHRELLRLDTCQSQISEQLLDTEDAVQEYLDDMEDAENYRDRYIEMCTRVDLKIRETVVPTETEKEALNYRKSN